MPCHVVLVEGNFNLKVVLDERSGGQQLMEMIIWRPKISILHFMAN